MKQYRIIFYGFFILITGFLSQANATPAFETSRIESIYKLLPVNIQSKISELPKERFFQISSDEIVPLSKLNICFNSESQLAHVGFKLFDTSLFEGAHEDVYYFIENSLLYFTLLPTTESIIEAAKNRKIDFIKNNVLMSPVFATKNFTPLIFLFENYIFSVNYNDNQVNCKFTFPNEEQFIIEFPANIVTVKGMNKDELEIDFIRKMKSFDNQIERSVLQNTSYYSSQVLPSGLYVQYGDKFESDNFRSDIYLKKENQFRPVFSSKFPVESFSNMFICTMQSLLQIDVSLILYGNKKEKYLMDMDKLLLFLSKNQRPYFGMQHYDEATGKIKATIIYNNPIYRFFHLLIVETDKTTLFDKATKNNIHAELHPYVSYENFIHDFNY